MQLFYTTEINDSWAQLGTEEARHCVQVLRKKPGDALSFVDGKGTLYHATIAETGKKSCLLQIQERQVNFAPRPFRLHLAVAPTKNIDRFEWLLEKATEIGVDSITPLLCQRSERNRIRQDRLEKVLIAAMKQSLKATLPQLQELTKYRDFLKSLPAIAEQRFIAHCNTDDLPLLKQNYQAGNDVIILIGPEGDFSLEEVQQAKEQGFVEISLGKSRLRTETAGIVACHTVNLQNEGI